MFISLLYTEIIVKKDFSVQKTDLPIKKQTILSEYYVNITQTAQIQYLSI